MFPRRKAHMLKSATRTYLVLIAFMFSLSAAEANWTTIDESAEIKRIDELTAVQKTAYMSIGAFAVDWVGLPTVSGLIRDKFKLIELELVSEKLKTSKRILFDVNAPCIYVDMEIDGSRVIFGPIVYSSTGEILTYPYARTADRNALKEKLMGR
jgi:hypothetical protein